MPDASRKVVVNCDICGDEMREQASGFACFPCKNFIPSDQLYRYAEHVTVELDYEQEADSGN